MEDCNDDFDISELARSNISTVFMVGLTISAYVWGALGDLKGRIWVFRRCVMVTLLGTILISVAWNFYVLIIAIFIVGIGLGGEITITGTVFMEFIP